MAAVIRVVVSALGRGAVLVLRLVLLPLDLLFLTWDFLRLAAWALDNMVPWLSEGATVPYEPCLESGVLEENRDGTLWVLGLSRKYATKRLLSLLFTDLRWHADANGRRYLCWCGTIDTPPTTPRRLLLAVVTLACLWGLSASVLYRYDLLPVWTSHSETAPVQAHGVSPSGVAANTPNAIGQATRAPGPRG